MQPQTATKPLSLSEGEYVLNLVSADKSGDVYIRTTVTEAAASIGAEAQRIHLALAVGRDGDASPLVMMYSDADTRPVSPSPSSDS